MIEAYSTNITATPNAVISFNTVSLKTGEVVTMEGNTAFSLNRSGIYNIEFNATATATTAGNVSVQLYKNGVPITQTLSTATLSNDGSQTLSFSTLLKVGCCPCGESQPKLSVMYEGVAGTISPTIIITKIR